MKEIAERLEEVERINSKLEKKEKDKEFKITKIGCENQFKFNNKIKEISGEKMRVELKKHFKNGLPPKVEELIKEGEKEIDYENHKLKIANEFGFKAVEDFVKEDLARDDKEEKKIKRLRKEKEREEKARGYRSFRGGRGSFRSFGDGRQGFEAREVGATTARTRSSMGTGPPRRATSPRPRTESSATTARALGTWPGSAPSLTPEARVGSEEE